MAKLDAFKSRNNPILLSDLPNSTESLSQQVGNTDRATHFYERDWAGFPLLPPQLLNQINHKNLLQFPFLWAGFLTTVTPKKTDSDIGGVLRDLGKPQRTSNQKEEDPKPKTRRATARKGLSSSDSPNPFAAFSFASTAHICHALLLCPGEP